MEKGKVGTLVIENLLFLVAFRQVIFKSLEAVAMKTAGICMKTGY